MSDINNQRAMPLQVVQFRRRPFPGAFSIESLFDELSTQLRHLGVNVETKTAPHFSKGVWARVKNILWAGQQAGRINHITGDIHYIALSLPGKKTILTIHDLNILDRLTGWKRRLVKYFWFDIPLKRVATVTVISQATKQRLLELTEIDESRVHVIPNTAKTLFRPFPKDFHVTYPRILHIGTKANKNLERTIAAVSGMKCHLEIIGRLSDAQKRLLKEHSIDFSNQYDLSDKELLNCYKNCDLLSFVSLAEGFGLPILEAQWVERPVITSNASSMPEVAGEGAILVEPHSVESIRNAIQAVINDSKLREDLIEAGRQNREKYEPTCIAKAYKELYERIERNSAPSMTVYIHDS